MKLKTTAITIKAGTSFEMPLMITKPNTTVHWVFYTRGYDIHFGIAKEGKEKERQYVVANTAIRRIVRSRERLCSQRLESTPLSGITRTPGCERRKWCILWKSFFQN